MMNIKEYTNEVKVAVEARLGENHIVNVQTKVAGPNLLSGLSVRDTNSNIAPTIYLDDMFEDNMSVEDAAARVIELTEKAQVSENVDMSFFQNIDSVRDLLTIRLVSDEAAYMYEQQEVVVRPLLDGINKIYCVPVTLNSENGNGNIIVRREHISFWNISEDELDDIAINNLYKDDSCEISSLLDLVAKLTGMPRENFGPSTPESDNILVVTNSTNMFGANVMLNKTVLDNILDKTSTESVFILPSSIHECICVPNNEMADIESLRELVIAVNSSEVAPEDKLSDNVYIYTREEGLAVA